MHTSPLKAYETIDKITMSGRELEATALTKAALNLRKCQENWDATNRDSMLEEALKSNQLIWSIFQSELVKESHPLPKKLRLDIIRLGAFVDKRTFETMAYPSPEKLTIIIEINNSLATALRNCR